MKLFICILLNMISIFCYSQNNKISGKWKSKDQKVVEIILVKTGEYHIRQISTPDKEESIANGKLVGEMTTVSPTEWKGRLLDVKGPDWYNAKFVLRKDGKLVYKVKWMMFSQTDEFEKVD